MTGVQTCALPILLTALITFFPVLVDAAAGFKAVDRRLFHLGRSMGASWWQSFRRIELPAAALALDVFLRKLDFLSIGTNDLIQYTLAIDRADESVAYLYDPLHPAVLTLVSGIIRRADKAGVPVTMCGEMAGDVTLTRLLLGMGLRNFSMHAAHVPDVKQQVLYTDTAALQNTARAMLRASDPVRLKMLLAKMNSLVNNPMNNPAN